MSSTNPTSPDQTREMHAHLFANLVMQQAGMTMIFLGVTPHPETGKTVVDLEAAQHFIAQLEMLEAKTKGNLSREEERLLQSSLGSLRLTYVEEAQTPGATPQASASPPTEGQEPAAKQPETPPTEQQKEAENKKKFSKKYD